MNKLSTEERKRVVAALVEGNSLRAITRMTGVHRTTVTNLLRDLGRACSEYQDKAFRNLPCKRIQCDEIWTYVLAKEKNCTLSQKAKGTGDVWTWVALCADTKLVPCWFLGQRHAGAAYHFMHDLSERLAKSRPTHDRWPSRLSERGRRCFWREHRLRDVAKDLRQRARRSRNALQSCNLHGNEARGNQWRADFDHVSTSYVERQNLTD
jgi:hypothetical protein